MSKVDYKKEREGKVFKNNQGYDFIINDYINYNKVLIKFLDKNEYSYYVTYKQCKDGTVFNPYHPTVVGVGYLGVGKHSATLNGKVSREYKLWENMLNRVYSNHQNYESYRDCGVCERWHCYQNFCDDLPLIENYELWLNNPNSRVALDKDAKIKGNKVYSLDACCFLTISENSEERNKRVPPKRLKVKGKSIYTSHEIEIDSLIYLPDGFHKSAISRGIGKNNYAMNNDYFWMRQEEFDYELYEKVSRENDKRVVVKNVETGETNIFNFPQEIVKEGLISRGALDKTLNRKNLKVINGYTYIYLRDVTTQEVEDYIKNNVDSTITFLHDLNNEEYLMSL